MRGEVSIAPLLYNIIYTKIVEGAPAEAIFAPEGVPIIPYADGITKTAKSPNAAKLFMNWRLSKEGQAFQIAKLGNITSMKEPPSFPKGWDPKVIKVWVPNFDAVREAARALARAVEQDLRLPSVTSALLIEDLVKRFATGKPAVDGVSFDVPAGEIVVLLGPSGCGKTTTLRCVAGLEHPTGGRISIGDRVVSEPERGVLVQPARARHRHGVPVLRRVAAHDGAPERGLSAEAPPQERRRRRHQRQGQRDAASWSASATMPSGR